MIIIAEGLMMIEFICPSHCHTYYPAPPIATPTTLPLLLSYHYPAPRIATPTTLPLLLPHPLPCPSYCHTHYPALPIATPTTLTLPLPLPHPLLNIESPLTCITVTAYVYVSISIDYIDYVTRIGNTSMRHSLLRIPTGEGRKKV
jgi:hypothetical protein